MTATDAEADKASNEETDIILDTETYNIADADVTLFYTKVAYDGNYKEPKVKVSYNEISLKKEPIIPLYTKRI